MDDILQINSVSTHSYWSSTRKYRLRWHSCECQFHVRASPRYRADQYWSMYEVSFNASGLDFHHVYWMSSSLSRVGICDFLTPIMHRCWLKLKDLPGVSTRSLAKTCWSTTQSVLTCHNTCDVRLKDRRCRWFKATSVHFNIEYMIRRA